MNNLDAEKENHNTVLLDTELANKTGLPQWTQLKQAVLKLVEDMRASPYYSKVMLWLVASVLVGVIALFFMFYLLPKDSRQMSHVMRLQGQLLELSNKSLQAYQTGDVKTMADLVNIQKNVTDEAKHVGKLLSDEANKRLANNQAKVVYLQERQEELAIMHKVHRQITENMPAIVDGLTAIADSGVPNAAARAELEKLGRLSAKMQHSIVAINAGGYNSYSLANDLSSSRDEFVASVEKLKLYGLSATQLAELDSVEEKYTALIMPSLMPIMGVAATIDKSQQGVSEMVKGNDKIRQELVKLDTRKNAAAKQLLTFMLMLASLLGLVFTYLKYASYRRAELDSLANLQALRIKRENEEKQQEIERNNTAILRLMEELADLADGDLSTMATVSEDFTGAIADSINSAIEQLRYLVQNINQTAVKVSSSANVTQGLALKLAQTSEHQSQQISSVSAAISEMAVSIDDVSRNAMESAQVAEQSVDIARNGAELVERNMDGMDNIREQIQDTAKRLKRLGESSQEIGNIVSLINDITDQTNILALNAAIQASAAGEAGRGFAVVADEVQRLAERSAFATKEIETLVKTIQSDTNEAVISMEQTTAEVVRGAKLSKQSGIALEDIRRVSQHLSDLIQNISNAARQQAVSAGHVANTMTVIQETTSQNTAGTISTSHAVGELAEMAQVLKKSVDGFKLPE